MTITANGTAATEHASRYLQQLCKHWSHRLEVTFDAAQGTVRFPEAVATFDARVDEIAVRIEAHDAATIAGLKKVVVEHLDRFAHREAPLPFVWQDGA